MCAHVPFASSTLSTRDGKNPIPIKSDLRLLPDELAPLSYKHKNTKKECDGLNLSLQKLHNWKLQIQKLPDFALGIWSQAVVRSLNPHPWALFLP